MKNPFVDRETGRVRALWRVLMTAVFIVVVMQLLKPAIQLSPPAHRSTVTNFALMMVTLAALWLLARYVDRRAFADYGLRFEMRALLIGSVVGFALVSVAVATAAAMGWVRVARIFSSEFPTESFVVLFLSQVGRSYFGSVFEEGLSRGVVLKNAAEGLAFTRWPESKRVWTAYGLSSVLFGLQHAGNTGITALALVNLVGLGLLFGAARLWTGGLSCGIGVHAAWNIASSNVFGTAADGGAEGGVREVSLLALRVDQHAPWFGGAYGIEGSALATAVIAIAFVVLVGIPALRGRLPELGLAAYRPRADG